VADAAIAGGDPTMALSVSQSILNNDPNNVDALVHEGEAYYALDRCPAAEAAFQLALKYDAKSGDAETGYGRCLLKVDPAGAEAAFIAATRDDPGNANALSDLGIARDLQGNFPGAATAYEQSLMANPGSTATAVNLGLSLALSGQGPQALQYLGPIATGPDATPKIREDYAVALVASGRNDDARQILSIDMAPDQVDHAMAGFEALISRAITNPPPPAAPAPTQPVVPTAAVMAVPDMPQGAPVPLLMPATAPAEPAPIPAPMPAPMTAVPSPPAPVMPAVAPAKRVMAASVVKHAKRARAKPAVLAEVKPVVQAAAPPAAPALPAPALPASAMPAPAASSATAVLSPAQIAALKGAPAVAPMPVAVPAPVPAPMPAAVSAPVPASAPAIAAAPTGHAAVQIAALNSENAAQAEWRKVSAKAPSLFADKAPDISRVEVGGQTYYRLRVGGFTSHADAAQFCSQATAAGAPCMPGNF
jgi:Flp pilus assembly protein TadD